MPSSSTLPNEPLIRSEIVAEVERLEPWFHCIDLGDGLVTKSQSAIGEPVEHPRPTWEKVKICLPENLSGKSVLDVGCNAGFYSIEMKRRGAARVLGIDSQRDLIRQALFVRQTIGTDIEYRRMSVYDLEPRELGQFDITLALGLIYHCKHLVLALEKLFLITRDLLVLETAIYPPEKVPDSFVYAEGGADSTLHPLAYIENLPDAKEAVFNWFVPGTEALSALLRNVGFDDVKVFPGAQNDRAVFACRKREPWPDSRSISYLGSKLDLIDGPSRCGPNDELRFRLQLHNSGYARWLRGREGGTEKGDVHLVAHLLDANEQPIAWYHAGAFLPHDVAPGETVETEIVLRAPGTTGSFWLEFDMVSEHLAWFEDLGSLVVKHQLAVE
jgi:tRNA (mo5U34)-methyltransferase